MLHLRFDLFHKFEKYKINFSVLSSLGECGLLNTDGFTYQNYEIGENTRRFLFTDKYMLMFCGDKTHKVELNVYHLTKAGRELLNIIECEPNSDYLFDVADCLCVASSQKCARIGRVCSKEGKMQEHQNYGFTI